MDIKRISISRAAKSLSNKIANQLLDLQHSNKCDNEALISLAKINNIQVFDHRLDSSAFEYLRAAVAHAYLSFVVAFHTEEPTMPTVVKSGRKLDVLNRNWLMSMQFKKSTADDDNLVIHPSVKINPSDLINDEINSE